jgi:hypothetical protein
MKTIFATILALMITSSLSRAQDTLYIYKSGAVANKQAVADVDSIIFYAQQINPVIPTLTTLEISSITLTEAESGGFLSSDGGATIITRGVCWSTIANPTVSDSKTIDGSGTGEYTSSIIGLTSGQTYFVRAYATNSAGTGYGNVISFNSGNLSFYRNFYSPGLWSQKY